MGVTQSSSGESAGKVVKSRIDVEDTVQEGECQKGESDEEQEEWRDKTEMQCNKGRQS